MDKEVTQINEPWDKKIVDCIQDLHTRYDIYRQYVPRKDGGRWLPCIKDCVDISIQGLVDYILKSKERRLITSAGNSIGNIRPDRKTTKTKKKTEMKEKQIHKISNDKLVRLHSRKPV